MGFHVAENTAKGRYFKPGWFKNMIYIVAPWNNHLYKAFVAFTSKSLAVVSGDFFV